MAALAAVGALAQSACGQRGDLVLPPEKAAEATRLADRAARLAPKPAATASSSASTPFATSPTATPALTPAPPTR